jgi:hypothetical protein
MQQIIEERVHRKRAGTEENEAKIKNESKSKAQKTADLEKKEALQKEQAAAYQREVDNPVVEPFLFTNFPLGGTCGIKSSIHNYQFICANQFVVGRLW